jgi:hypothetical protein
MNVFLLSTSPVSPCVSTLSSGHYDGLRCTLCYSVSEFIDPVFTKTSPKRSFSVIQNERFGPVFAKTGSIISGTVCFFVVHIHKREVGVLEEAKAESLE